MSLFRNDMNIKSRFSQPNTKFQKFSKRTQLTCQIKTHVFRKRNNLTIVLSIKLQFHCRRSRFLGKERHNNTYMSVAFHSNGWNLRNCMYVLTVGLIRSRSPIWVLHNLLVETPLNPHISSTWQQGRSAYRVRHKFCPLQNRSLIVARWKAFLLYVP